MTTPTVAATANAISLELTWPTRAYFDITIEVRIFLLKRIHRKRANTGDTGYRRYRIPEIQDTGDTGYSFFRTNTTFGLILFYAVFRFR
jgi:hypothetical protein